MKLKNRFRIYPLAIMGVCLVLINSCKKPEDPSKTKVPDLTTQAVTDITTTAAKCGGTISFDGGAAVTARGVCWSTNATPTIADSKTSDGTLAGTFASVLTGLKPNTTYYVRAYATNSVGTGYGAAVSFNTLDGPGGGAPESYTHKVMVEYTTCAGCPYCPDGEYYVEKLITKFGSNVVYGTAMHNLYQGADGMAGDESKAFSDGWSTGNPTGAVNRITGKCETRSAWDGRANSITDEVAKCGLSIDASVKTGNKYAVKVRVGIGKTDLPAGKYYVIAYMTKKTMTGTGSGWDQANGYNGTTTSPFYLKGNPIKNYVHTNVFIKSLNTMTGTLMDALSMKGGSLTDYNMEIDMTGLVASEYEISAFVYFKSVSSPYIENVQRVAVGQIKAFD